MRRSARPRALTPLTGLLLAGLLGGLAAGPPAAAAPTAAATTASTATTRSRAVAPVGLVTRLDGAARSRYLGAHLSGVVVDEATGEVVWSRNADRGRLPASTQKLVTAYTALRTLGPQRQLITRSVESTAVPGNVYLVGAGDPTLTSARLRTLAQRTASALKAQGRSRITLYADASALPAPSLAPGWKASYVAQREVQPIRGLTLAGYRGPNGSLAAATAFRAHLVAAGISVGPVGPGVAPATQRELSASWSVPVATMVAQMLRVSDNDIAEYLLRAAAAADGASPTWAAAAEHARRVLEADGIPLAGYAAFDGSGLSRSNRMPVATLAAAVDRMWDDPALRAVAFGPSAMPRAGRTGTLSSRFSAPAQRCARGRVAAKTGTLDGVVGLAGLADGVDGRRRVFVFLTNGGGRTASVRSATDSLATAVVGC